MRTCILLACVLVLSMVEYTNGRYLKRANNRAVAGKTKPQISENTQTASKAGTRDFRRAQFTRRGGKRRIPKSTKRRSKNSRRQRKNRNMRGGKHISGGATGMSRTTGALLVMLTGGGFFGQSSQRTAQLIKLLTASQRAAPIAVAITPSSIAIVAGGLVTANPADFVTTTSIAAEVEGDEFSTTATEFVTDLLSTTVGLPPDNSDLNMEYGDSSTTTTTTDFVTNLVSTTVGFLPEELPEINGRNGDGGSTTTTEGFVTTPSVQSSYSSSQERNSTHNYRYSYRSNGRPITVPKPGFDTIITF